MQRAVAEERDRSADARATARVLQGQLSGLQVGTRCGRGRGVSRFDARGAQEHTKKLEEELSRTHKLMATMQEERRVLRVRGRARRGGGVPLTAVCSTGAQRGAP